ncbi:hypothetical protein PHLGIDRAFT_30533 [Phlebiopsis gigantea 11061_1 CR5-6]|uniref:Mitochondrial carrier n=1 Tax=Phlebiopsis gigantea (strain 11061_1 CR5-6) TaxID=745531 RepID=A0A0C3S6N9_PHLG1|nr:hypothetical protein PHLGIDRAFT_30533 [Phlebiopsis gigantea 11061_1 CR5-6]
MFLTSVLLCNRFGVACACTHPLDLTKVRLQTAEHSPGAPSPSMYTVIRTAISESGYRSLYTGLSASIFRQMTTTLTRLGAYEKIKETLLANGPPSHAQLLLAAMIAGGIGGVVGNPADILFVRIISDSMKPPAQRYNYSSVSSGLMSILRTEGFKGLTRGMDANTASQVGSYDFVKTHLLARPLPLTDYQFRDNILCHVASSTLAGTIATTITSPADVLRARLMAVTSNKSSIEVLRQALREEGPKFLLKGWTPAFIRLGPNTVLMFVFFEQFKRTWRTLFPVDSRA